MLNSIQNSWTYDTFVTIDIRSLCLYFGSKFFIMNINYIILKETNHTLYVLIFRYY